jgi:multicomponent Na+:H+ antiporter subunit D
MSATVSGGLASLAPWAIAVPIIVGCLLLAIGRYLPRLLLDGIAFATAAAVIVIEAALLAGLHGDRVVTWSGGWTPRHGFSVGIALVADRMGVGIALLAAVLVACALLYTWRYYEDVEAHLHVMVLFFLAGITGFALTGDLFDMFVFFELMGAVGYALTAFRIEDRTAVQGGVNFAVVNSFGAYVTLMGIGVLYSKTGQLGLAALAQSISRSRNDVFVVTAFVLVCTGWLVKAAAVPFHFWTADAEAVAPSPVCALFSGVMVELGVYGVARVYWTVFRDALPADAVSRALLVLGVLTAVLGAVMCVAQHNFKRLLAYSTIAHVGLFLTAVGALSADGLAGAAVYVLGHAGIKGALFLLAGIVLNRYGSVDEFALFGRCRRGLLAALVVLCGLALAGLPPFAVGLGKGVAEDGLSAAQHPWAPALFVAVSALTGGAVLRVAGRIFFGLGVAPERADDADTGEEMGSANEPEARLQRIPVSMLIAVGVLVLGALVIGLLPDVVPVVTQAADRFVDTRGYVAQVLHGAAATPLPRSDTWWTAKGVALDLVSVVLACTVAAAALYGRRFASPTRLLDPAKALMRGLHRIHSGHIGDYVAWLVVGIAGLLVLVGLPVLT